MQMKWNLSMAKSEELIIDIDRIIDGKMKGKAWLIPGFLRSILKKIVHQDEVNRYLKSVDHLKGVPWLDASIEYLGMDMTIRGRENFPSDADGQLFTFVSNHPLGGQDGIAIGQVLGNQYNGKIRYLVNDILMNLPGLAPLCVGINKTGSQAKNFPALVKAVFDSPNHVIMFPAGLCSRKQSDGSIHDLEWKKTFIQKSVETHRDVVPIHFSGRNSDFFYNLANACKTLGIKFNIAMLFLVDEMYKNVNKPYTMTIGKPIPWQTFDKSKTPAQWAQYVQDIVYKLQ